MGHTATSTADLTIEQVHQHIFDNSWMNIIHFDNWTLGWAEDAEDAKKWAKANAKTMCKYFAVFPTNGVDVKEIIPYFSRLDINMVNGYPSAQPEAAKFIFVFKTFL